MQVAAIITEYNPFHLGHAYQLSQIKADYIMVIMSGNYVQRGEPAIVDKWTRAEMALAEGVDLVLELPTAVATGSAEYFAMGAVFLLEQTQIVRQLCFGAEHPKVTDLQTIAEIFLTESPEFSALLQDNLKKGNSYAASRQVALESLFPMHDYGKILKGSNNILAIEYLKALLHYQSRITPCLIPRQGQNYLDHSYRPDIFMSATAIRRLLRESSQAENLNKILPDRACRILAKAISEQKAPIYSADIYPFLRTLLLQANDNDLTKRREITPPLLHRMRKALDDELTYDEYIATCSSRNFPASKIKRALLYLFLNQTQPEPLTVKNSYLKILGFRPTAAPLLRRLKESSTIPVITNTRNAKILSPEAKSNYLAELRYDRLYAEILYQKYGNFLPSSEQRNPVIPT